MESNEEALGNGPQKVIEYHSLIDSSDSVFMNELIGVLQLFLSAVIVATITLFTTALMLRGNTNKFGFFGFMPTIFIISVAAPIIFAIIIILVKWRTGDFSWRENTRSLLVWIGLLIVLRIALYV